MSQSEHENLSALMDGELDSNQLRFMLRRMDSNMSLCAAWERYHLVGDSLRHDMPGLADAGFADRIMQEIGATSGARGRHGSHRWLRWSAGGAIAAGVAVAALVAVQPRMGGMTTRQAAATSSASSSRAVATANPVTTSANEPAGAPSVPRWLSASPAAAQLAQPAAATFSPAGQPLGQSEPLGYYSPGLAPYMTIPHAHALRIRGSSPQAAHRWWPSVSQHQQHMRQEWRLQAQ